MSTAGIPKTTTSAFFYGTLLHPKVLKRVIGNDGSHLKICLAVLLNHTRHRVKHADYPGLLPYAKSRDMFDRELSREETSVRGNLVAGLTKTDLFYLDHFEGSEYALESVSVYQLGPLEELNDPSDSVIAASAPSLPPPDELKEPVQAVTYIWDASPSDLIPELWSYELFIRDSAWKWVGPNSHRDDYDEVEKRREANGVIDKAAEDALKDGALN